jgi:signal transduction histidine kinase
MSLAVRLLLALGAVALFVSALVGFSAREVAQQEAERSFEQRIEAAIAGARDELVWEADSLSELLAPLCKHDSFVDHTLLDLERAGGDVDKLPEGRGISLREIVPAQRKALRLDELSVVSGDGHIIGSSDSKRLGTRDPSLGRLLREETGRARLVWRGGDARLQIHCSRASSGVTLGLVGARDVAPILKRVGTAYGVTLSLKGATAPAEPGALERELVIAQIPGLEVKAAISRQPLHETLAHIDSSILLSGAIALLLSVAVAVLVARGLSRPIAELAQQTREVVRGNPHPVRGRGGRELTLLAKSFNQTINELSSMRRRLARTERIAARREVARQVAHEIKNPLAPIRAAVETLRRLRARGSPEFDAYFDEATKTVLDEVHRIKNIVSEFTKFARMPPPRFERIELGELAASVVGWRDAPPGESGPRVELVDEAEVAIMADHDQMVQMLTNLVDNGIEAASPVRDDPEVVVTISRVSEREVRIEVRDNGPGIDPSVRNRLFEPYVSTKAEGTGLGLAIVQTIVHEHGADISCRDSEEGGAVFEVVLPIDGPPLLDKAPNITGESG